MIRFVPSTSKEFRSFSYIELTSVQSNFRSNLNGLDLSWYMCDGAPIAGGFVRNARGEETRTLVIELKKSNAE